MSVAEHDRLVRYLKLKLGPTKNQAMLFGKLPAWLLPLVRRIHAMSLPVCDMEHEWLLGRVPVR
jgi:hypothetical protein